MSYDPISDSEFAIRQAAIAASYGLSDLRYPEPHKPSDREDAYLLAIYHFRNGRQCAGWDAVERGDAMAGL